MTEINQTTKFVADKAGEQYVVNVELKTPGMAIDASAAVTGRSFIVNGILSAGSGTAILLGSASLADSQSYVKIGDVGTFTSGGKGLVAASGGVTFENVGMFSAVSTAVQFKGDNNTFKNVSSKDGPGQLSSTNGSALVSAGDSDRIENTGSATITARRDAIVSTGDHVSITNNSMAQIISTSGSALVSAGKSDRIENTGSATITARRDAIVSTGDHVSITNNGMAQIISTSGAAIVVSGKRDTIYSVSMISAERDAIVSAGDRTTITIAGDGTLTSGNGHGILSMGDDDRLTNQAEITSRLDGIFSAGADVTIVNTATITSRSGAAIRSTGDDAVITSSTLLSGKTFGIISTGDHVTITNFGDVNATGTGIRIAGDDAILTTKSHVTANTAIAISGNDAVVTIENEIAGLSRTAATIEITSTGSTAVTNRGAIGAASGVVIEAGKGVESILNTGSLYGDVKLGAGNDWFSSLKGEVTGAVHGGKGNDVYVVGIPLAISETAGEGIDTVQSRFTYALGANIENLELLGKGTMDATGNSLANRITGNAGNNHLTGLGGKDVFVFGTGARQDIVTDFTDGKDRMDLSGYQGIDSFADLRAKIDQSGDDVTITFDGHDRLTLESIHKADLSTGDFLF
ncbi:MAG: hemolysin-type calcium-binding repeat family protein [Rhizobium sp.]|nr:hemolysin-type calcium-binding repeat family protein [Rhizobium sp.]